MWYVSRVFVSPTGCPLSCFHDYGVTSTVMYLHGSGSFFDSYFWECKSDMLSLHKISCTREIESKLSFRSLALSLHKISCAREIESKLSFRSFALSLHKISFGSAIASLIKLRFQNLLLHSPCIIFAKDRLRSGSRNKKTFRLFAASLGNILSALCSIWHQLYDMAQFIFLYLKLKNYHGRKQQSETGLSH